MVAIAKEPVQRLLLYSIPWKSYDAILHALQGRRLRITYDRGTLEIMSVPYPHGESLMKSHTPNADATLPAWLIAPMLAGLLVVNGLMVLVGWLVALSAR